MNKAAQLVENALAFDLSDYELDEAKFDWALNQFRVIYTQQQLAKRSRAEAEQRWQDTVGPNYRQEISSPTSTANFRKLLEWGVWRKKNQALP